MFYAVISCLTSARTCGEFHTHATRAPALLHLGEQPTTPIAQAMLGATAVECIQISATVSNDRACNDEFVIL